MISLFLFLSFCACSGYNGNSVNSPVALLCGPSATIPFVFNNFLAQWLLVMTETLLSFVSSHRHILRWRPCCSSCWTVALLLCNCEPLRMLFIVPQVRDTRIWSTGDVIIYQREQKYSEINWSVGGLADRSTKSTTCGWIEKLPRLTSSG